MSENNIDYEQKAQEMLTPRQRVMSESRAVILGPLDKLELSEVEKNAVGVYADKVAELAGRELDRLQTESPLRQILAAMEEYLPVDTVQPGEKAKDIRWIAEMAGKWQAAIREEQGLALLQRRSTQQKEIIGQLWNAGQIENFPTRATVFLARDAGQKDLLNKFLNNLGVLPEGANVDTLYKLPVNNWDFSRNAKEINEAIREGKPTRILDGKTVIGLKSDKLPEVEFQVNEYFGRFSVGVQFRPEAILHSVTSVVGVEK